MIFFSTSGLFLFFVHYRGDEITDVVRVPRNCGAPQAPLLIIHYLSPLHIYVVKIWQWRFSFYVNWKYLFNVHPFITGLSDDKQPHNRLGNLYYILLTSSHLQKKKPPRCFLAFLPVCPISPFCFSRKMMMKMVEPRLFRWLFAAPWHSAYVAWGLYLHFPSQYVLAVLRWKREKK